MDIESIKNLGAIGGITVIAIILVKGILELYSKQHEDHREDIQKLSNKFTQSIDKITSVLQQHVDSASEKNKVLIEGQKVIIKETKNVAKLLNQKA